MSKPVCKLCMREFEIQNTWSRHVQVCVTSSSILTDTWCGQVIELKQCQRVSIGHSCAANIC